MIMPLMTALPVSQIIDVEISGESFTSRKDAHSLLIRAVKLGSSNSDVLKRHLVEGLFCTGMAKDNEMGAWSLMIIGWIVFSEIC